MLADHIVWRFYPNIYGTCYRHLSAGMKHLFIFNHCSLLEHAARVMCICLYIAVHDASTRVRERKYIHTRFILLPEIESYIMKKIRYSCSGVCECVCVWSLVVVGSHSGGLPIRYTRTQVGYRVECVKCRSIRMWVCALIGNVVNSVDTHF